MINKTLTGITLNSYSPGLTLFYRICDVFLPSSKIQFTSPLNSLNNILGTSITSVNINTHKLYVRISNSISESSVDNILFDNTIDLSVSNLIDGSFIVDISDITNKISHDYLCDTMNVSEIYSLLRSYKIIFRIFTGTLSDINNIISTDIIQDLNITLNTAESGPYNVVLDEIDLVSPDNFSYNERVDIYKQTPGFIGLERIRAFYPKQINGICPLFVHIHGNGQFTSGYDLYLSTLASYGYFCISLSGIHNATNSTTILSTINHIKNNFIKIFDEESTPSIDFNKIIFSGHSRGGNAIYRSLLMLKNKEYISSISNYNIDYSDIVSYISFADAFAGSLHENQGLESVTISSYGIQEDFLKYFDINCGIPVFNIKGTHDGDSTNIRSLIFRGYSANIGRNDKEIINITPYSMRHGSIYNPFFTNDKFGDDLSFSTAPSFSALETTKTYNTSAPILNEIKSELLLFLAINVFSSNKLRKLYNQNINF